MPLDWENKVITKRPHTRTRFSSVRIEEPTSCHKVSKHYKNLGTVAYSYSLATYIYQDWLIIFAIYSSSESMIRMVRQLSSASPKEDVLLISLCKYFNQTILKTLTSTFIFIIGLMALLLSFTEVVPSKLIRRPACYHACLGLRQNTLYLCKISCMRVQTTMYWHWTILMSQLVSHCCSNSRRRRITFSSLPPMLPRLMSLLMPIFRRESVPWVDLSRQSMPTRWEALSMLRVCLSILILTSATRASSLRGSSLRTSCWAPKLPNQCKSVPFTSSRTPWKERPLLTSRELRTIKKKRSKRNKLKNSREKMLKSRPSLINWLRNKKLKKSKQRLKRSSRSGKLKSRLRFKRSMPRQTWSITRLQPRPSSSRPRLLRKPRQRRLRSRPMLMLTT